MHWPTIPSACALVAALLPAQTFVTTTGRVVDTRGDGVARAQVTFLGEQPPMHLATATPHVAEATTDGEGRFRVQLVVGHQYCAWAVGEAELDGRRLVTAVANEVLPGMHRELVMTRRRSPSSLRVRGHERWADVGPLQLHVSVASPCRQQIPLPLAAAPSPLPPLPDGSSWCVSVADARGQPLATIDVPPEPGDLTCYVPPPQELTVRVATRDGKPAAAVVLRAHVAGTDWREVGTTDATGTCIVRVPLRRRVGAVDALPPLWAGHEQLGAALRAEAPPPVDGRLSLPLGEAQTWRGRLRVHGAPLARARVRLDATHTWSEPDFRRTWGPSFGTTTDEDGRFAIAGLPADLDRPCPRIAPDPATAAGSSRLQRPVMKDVRLDQPFEHDLAELPRCIIEAVDVAGRPAHHAWLWLLPDPASRRTAEAHRTHLDAGGKATLAIMPGEWMVLVSDRDGFAAQVLSAPERRAIELRLQPLATMQGRIVMPARSEATDVTFGLNLVQLPHATTTHERGLCALGPELNRRLLQRPRLDATGSFTLRFLDLDGASWKGFVTTPAGSAPLQLQAGAEAVTIRPGNR